MGKSDIEGGEVMIVDELKILFDEIKSEISLLKAELTLISYDTTKLREQLDRIEQQIPKQTEENIGIAPNTPPPTFIPPEYL
jgi:chaperonin cofactor prefoldin